MKTTILEILVASGILIYLAKPTIRLSPFSVKFESLLLSIGMGFILMGMVMVAFYYYGAGYEDRNSPIDHGEVIDNGARIQDHRAKPEQDV